MGPAIQIVLDVGAVGKSVVEVVADRADHQRRFLVNQERALATLGCSLLVLGVLGLHVERRLRQLLAIVGNCC